MVRIKWANFIASFWLIYSKEGVKAALANPCGTLLDVGKALNIEHLKISAANPGWMNNSEVWVHVIQPVLLFLAPVSDLGIDDSAPERWSSPLFLLIH